MTKKLPTREEVEYLGERIIFLEDDAETVYVCRRGKTWKINIPLAPAPDKG